MPENSSSYKRLNLRTIVETKPMNNRARYSDRIMLMGSCFTEHIGNRLKSLKFPVLLNPFGIVYNPLSVSRQLRDLIDRKVFNRSDLVFHQDLWHSWQHHSRFSNPDPDELLGTINRSVIESADFLSRTDLLILTFGTPEAFYLKSDNRLVSNCHQLPADRFYSRKPDPAEWAEPLIPLIRELKENNPDLRICLTISPVRYFKDGPTGNQISKSILFLGMRILQEAFPDLFYFPSYEIFMDDLRDYRFYDSDMMHPGVAGIDYVWSRFAEACIDPAAYPLMSEVEALVKAVGHRQGNHLTDARRNFIQGQLERISTLQERNSFLDFTEEVETLKAGLESDDPGSKQ